MAIKSRVTRLEQASGRNQALCWTEMLTNEGREISGILSNLVDKMQTCGADEFRQKIEEANERIKPLRAVENAARRKAGVIVPQHVAETIERHTRKIIEQLESSHGS